jgi:hypothetical protein
MGPTISLVIILGDPIDNCELKVVFACNLKRLTILTVHIG